MPAFRYRERRTEDEWKEASAGETVRLRETGTYSLQFPKGLSPSERVDLQGLGFEVVDEELVLASFGNFVGTTHVRGVELVVESVKLGSGGMSALLQDTVELAAELIYGWGSPVGHLSERSGRSDRRVPYHDFLYLRHELLVAEIGERLQDFFGVVATQPTRRLRQDYVRTQSHNVRRIDRRSWVGLASRAENFVSVEPSSPFYAHPLAKALEVSGRHMPLAVTTPIRVESFDTPENRFVRHLLLMCQSAVGRFLEHPKLHAGLRRDARLMSELLQGMTDSALLEGVGLPSSVIAPTQAMTKGDGYRELFSIYRGLLEGVALPDAHVETLRFLDGQDVATLYEYWVFLKVAACLRAVTHEKPAETIGVATGEMGVLLRRGLTLNYPSGVEVSFNRTFAHAPGKASYSTTLRPDVVVRRGASQVVLDAKYRLDSLDLNDDDHDEAMDGNDPRWWKQADLHKMHAYRDAIQGVAAAFVVYPGNQFVFFDVSKGKCGDVADLVGLSGVGALPLRPGVAADLDQISNLLIRFLQLD